MRPKISSLADKQATSYKDKLLNGEILNSNSTDESDEDFRADTDYDSSSDSSKNSESDPGDATDNSSQTIHNQSDTSQASFTNYLNGQATTTTIKKDKNPQLFKRADLYASRVCCVCLNDENM